MIATNIKILNVLESLGKIGYIMHGIMFNGNLF